MTLDEDIKIIDLPNNERFKLVQIIVDGHPVMVCGPTNKFHKDLLENFLKSEKIPYKTKTREDGKQLVSLEGERYQVVGMGEGDIRSNLKYLELPYGKSFDYQITPNKDFRERLKQQFSGWEF